MRERIQATIAAQTAKNETPDEQLYRSNKERIATLRSQLKDCLPRDRAGLYNRIEILDSNNRKLEAKMDEQKRRTTLGEDRRVQLARESADALERSWQAMYPHANADDVCALDCDRREATSGLVPRPFTLRSAK